MMLVLSRLGAALDRSHRSAPSTACARPRTLFEDIHDDFGHSQAVAVLGRALVLAGHVEEGLDARRLDGPARRVGSLTERECTVVDDGGPERHGAGGRHRPQRAAAGRSPAGSVDRRRRRAHRRRHRAHDLGRRCTACSPATSTGRWPGSPTLQQRLLPEIDPNLHSALALAHAASGAIDEALTEADEVDAHDRASYLDRITAGIARGLALARGGDRRRRPPPPSTRSTAAADATEDRVLAGAGPPRRRDRGVSPGEADAATRMAEAEAPSRRPRDCTESGWRQAYALAVGRARVAAGQDGCLTTRR